MFTGIITNTTPIVDQASTADGLKLTFKKPASWSDLQLGESVATDGVCLTVAAIRSDKYDCVLVPETFAKTSFGKSVPAEVNLERSLHAADRFGGHFVQGHVDGIGTVEAVDKKDGFRLRIAFDARYKDLVIPKGSITVNGVSLTVAELKDLVLEVALVPHTLEHTTLGSLKTGDVVNLEFDMIGKYIARIMEHQRATR